MKEMKLFQALFVFKAKITSRGFLDKLKAHCVAKGIFNTPMMTQIFCGLHVFLLGLLRCLLLKQ